MTEITETIATDEVEEEEEIIPDYVPRTEDELRALAKQIYRNEIFSTWHIRASDSEMIPSIFMPLVFMSPKYIDWMTENEITFLYAVYADSPPAPIAVNGYPVFYSMGMLNAEDEVRLREMHNTILEVMGEKEKEDDRDC